MAHVVKDSKGKKVAVLLNPSEKGKRYARQMKTGVVKETGQKLDQKGMAYRAGYLDARKDSAKAYCHSQGIKSKSQKSYAGKRGK